LIVASNWQVGYDSGSHDQKLPDSYPGAYTIVQNEPDPENPHDHPSPQTLWIGKGDIHFDDYPNALTLAALFDQTNTQPTFPFPLAVPLTDVFLGQNGWPTLAIKDWTTYSPPDNPPYSAPQRPVPQSPTFQVAQALSRNPETGQYLLQITVKNRG